MPRQQSQKGTVVGDGVQIFHRGELQQNLLLNLQDTGGQPMFVQVLDLLSCPWWQRLPGRVLVVEDAGTLSSLRG